MSSESVVQQRVRAEFPALVPGGQLWRNNTGALFDADGRLIRFGLANDSAELNKVIKSSDLIGITPVLITQEMVGYYLGVMTALETKPTGWKLRPGDARGQAQAKFHQLVKDACGFAGFVTGIDDAMRIIGRG